MDQFPPREVRPQLPSVSLTPPNQTTPDTRYPPDPQQDLDKSDPNIAFMKGPKRKRLAKACDACHKSKRRCDGTAPCSNCYFASKKCTYTDASGKPVPAPRPLNPDRAESSSDARSGPCPPQADGPSSSSPSLNISSAPPNEVVLSAPPSDDDRASNPSRTKRLRTNLGDMVTPSGTPPRPLAPPLNQHDRTLERDQALTRELVHLFFAYRQPQRMIIHQPSFLSALTRGTVPQHLLLAVCAVAAPLSKQPRLRTSPCRYAGEMFAQEAVSLMFDDRHQLVCEHDLATAQALLLLQLYDRMGKSLWVGQHYQLALDIVTKIGIFDSDSTVLTPHPTPELIDACIERECARRVFWLILVSDCFGYMLYRRPRLATDSQMNLRLPIDETSFELSPLSAVPEFLSKPSPSYSMCSEIGQLVRMLLLHEEAEKFVDNLNDCENGRYPVNQLQALETRISAWADALPEHMRFTEDNLSVHVMQYDTSSNLGAWSFFVMHVIHCSCIFALHLGRQRCHFGASLDPSWAQERILKTIDALGRKAKLSIFLGLAIWPLFKYGPDPLNQTLVGWSSEFEEIWGVRMQDLCQRQSTYKQPPRAQGGPPPPMPPLPTPPTRVHTTSIPTGSISPVSRTGSDMSSSLVVQPPNYAVHSRMQNDPVFHSLPPSSYPETRMQVGYDPQEKEVRSTVADANIDPSLQVVSNARLHATSQLSVPPPVPPPLPSLPSLKASGLLEWPQAGAAPSSIQPGSSWQPPGQHFGSTRQPPQRDPMRQPGVQAGPDMSRPPVPSSSSGLPVGLQWLAQESSVSRPS